MGYIKRITAALSAFSILLIGCCGCGKKTVKQASYNLPERFNQISSTQLAENDSYSLSWDNEKNCVLLLDKVGNKLWSSVPEEIYRSDDFTGRAKVTMGSPIMIEYMTSDSEMLNAAYASTSAIDTGKTNAEKADNGITVTYFFDEFEISVPVTYSLTSDGLEVSVDPSKIGEGKNTLYSVSLMPFMCSAKNGAENSYLFVPSGSGALMYTDERVEGVRSFSGEVYGTDYARERKNEITEKYGIKLPVYGAKYKENAIFAVITSGAEQAFISAQAGDADVGYSSVCSKFYIRGYDNIETDGDRSATYKRLKLADSIASGAKFSVLFHPLNGENANYSGMAKYYRSLIGKKQSDDVLTSVRMVGGISVSKSFLGIPYTGEYPLTTISDAEKIVSEISEINRESKISVTLAGFGEGLSSISKVASGFKFSSKVGNKSEMKNLSDRWKENNISSYIDYDIIRFSKGLSGFGTVGSAAKNVVGIMAHQYEISPFVGSYSDGKISYLLKRNLLDDAVSKLIKSNAYSGIGLPTLGYMAYSDYSDTETYARGGIEKQVSVLLETVTKNKISVKTDSANAYAADDSDLVTQIPLWSDGYNAFDCDIPFYSIVFKGVTAMSGTDLNTSPTPAADVLKCLETGVALQYSLISEYSSECTEHNEYKYSQMLYSDNKVLIRETIGKSAEFLNAVANSKIQSNDILADGVSRTIFENGCYIVVNYNKTSVSTDYGTVGAEQFIWGRQG